MSEINNLESEINKCKKFIKSFKNKMKVYEVPHSVNACVSIKNTAIDKNNTDEKNKILFWADRQGRNCAKLANESFDYASSANIYPGAPLQLIVDAMICSKEIRYLGDKDWVVLIAGTNDLKSNFNHIDLENYIFNSERLVRATCHTHLILTTVPYRYDLGCDTVINKHIASMNRVTRAFCGKNGVPFIDVWTFESFKHTKHGLHLNNRGKRELIKKTLQIIESNRLHLLRHAGEVSKHGGSSFSVSENVSQDFLTVDEVSLSNNRDGPYNSAVVELVEQNKKYFLGGVKHRVKPS